MLFGVMIQATLRFDLSLLEEANGRRESACTIALRVAFLTAPLSIGTGTAPMRSMTGWLVEGESRVWRGVFRQLACRPLSSALCDFMCGCAHSSARDRYRPRRDRR